MNYSEYYNIKKKKKKVCISKHPSWSFKTEAGICVGLNLNGPCRLFNSKSYFIHLVVSYFFPEGNYKPSSCICLLVSLC